MNLDQLIKGCIKNDRRAQEELYRLYKGKLFPVCLKYCRTRSEAEDHLHDVFIEIFKKIETYKRTGSFEGWMKRIVIYKAIDKYKKNKDVAISDTRELSLSEDVAMAETDMLVSIDTIMRFIRELPDQYRIVFNLYQLDDYSHKEISGMLGISQGTSKSNLHRAKALLKTRILTNKKIGPSKTNNRG